MTLGIYNKPSYGVDIAKKSMTSYGISFPSQVIFVVLLLLFMLILNHKSEPRIVKCLRP